MQTDMQTLQIIFHALIFPMRNMHSLQLQDSSLKLTNQG